MKDVMVCLRVGGLLFPCSSRCGAWRNWNGEGDSVVGALYVGLVAVNVRTTTTEVARHNHEHKESDDGNCTSKNGDAKCDEWVFHGLRLFDI